MGESASSSSPRSDKDLIVDGESIYQYALNQLQVPKEKIHFYGYSLGGGVSAHVKALHPEATGHYVNERSFASIPHVVSMHTSKWCMGGVIGCIVNKLISLLNWNLDSQSALKNIQGKTLVVYHPQDEVVGQGAGFCHHAHAINKVEKIDLSEGNCFGHYFLHGDALSTFNTDKFKPEQQIIEFLKNSKV